MKKKIFYKVFAATLACVLLMFVFGIIAVHMNTDKIAECGGGNVIVTVRGIGYRFVGQ